MDINSISSRAAKWSMEGDCMLFQWMQEISQSLETQSLKVSSALAQLNTDLHRNSINLDNASNNLSSLQHTQFVENLCQEDYSELQQQNTATPVEQAEVTSNPVDNMRNFLINNMNVINECSEKYSLEMDDSDDESENSYIYQLKNPYNDRLLPHIYGTKLWNDFSHVGLCLGNNSIEEEEEMAEAFDESSTSQVYDANNSSSCSLSQWASSTSLGNENNKSLTNIKSYPVFDEMSEQITATSPLEISSSDLPNLLTTTPQLYETLATNVPVQTTLTPANQTERGIPRTNVESNLFEKPEMDQVKIMPKKPTENETLTKIIQEKQDQKTIPPKNESFLKFQAKVLFDDDDEDDDFLNIFSKSKVQTTKPKENKISDDLENANIFSNTKQGPAYLKELESKLFTQKNVKESHTVDELDEGIFSRGMQSKSVSEKLEPTKKNYANVLSNEPPDDFDDFLPVPSPSEQVNKDKFKHTSETQTKKFTAKDYNAFGFFNEIPPDDDDFFGNEQMEQKDSPQHFIESPKVTKPTKNVSKLKMPKININVQALLPQSPATSKNLEPEKVLEEIKSTDTEHQYVLQNVCKNRVRASAKRRPSTRQGRLSNYKQASLVAPEEETDSVEKESTKKTESLMGDLKKVMKKTTLNKAEDASILTKSSTFLKNHNEIVEEDENNLAEQQPTMSYDSVIENKKVMKKVTVEKRAEDLSTLTKSAIFLDSPTDDFDDIFSKPLKTENKTTTNKDIPEKKTKNLTTLTKSSLFLDSPTEDFDDIFAKPLNTENITKTTKDSSEKLTFENERAELNIPSLTNSSIFLDSPTEDFDDIFAKPLKTADTNKTNKEASEKLTFENEKSAENLFSNNLNEASVIVEKREKSESTINENINKTIKDFSQKRREDHGTFKKTSLFLDSPTEDFDDIFSEKAKTVPSNVEILEDQKSTENTNQKLSISLFEDNSIEDDLFTNKMEDSKKPNNLFDGKASAKLSSLHVNSILTDDTPPEDELFSTQQKLEKTGTSRMKLSFLDEVPPEDFDDILPKNITTKNSIPQMVFADDSPPEDFDDLFITKSNSSKSAVSLAERSIFTDEIPPEEFDDLFEKKTVMSKNSNSSQLKTSFPYDTPPEDFDDSFLKKTKMSEVGSSQRQKSTASFQQSTEQLFSKDTQSVKTKQKESIVKDDLYQEIIKPNPEPVNKSLEKSLFSDSEDENLLFNKASEKVSKPKQVKKIEPTKPLFGNESDSDDDLFGAVNSKSTRVIQKLPVVSAEQQQHAGAISKTKNKSLFEDTDEDDDDLFSSTKIVKNTSSFAKMSTTKIQSKVEKVVKKETSSDNPLADLL